LNFNDGEITVDMVAIQKNLKKSFWSY